MELVQVITTTETKEQASAIAKKLVEEKLCACAQISGPIESHYWWEGRMESATEWVISAKTTLERYPDVEKGIRQIHPYQVPEIIALPILRVLSDYAKWLEESLSA